MSSSYLETPEFLSLSLHLMTCVEIPVHVFGVYCILFQTPDSMKSVKRSMLNLHVWSVLLDLAISLMTTPYILFPTFAGFPMGVLREFGMPTLVQIWLAVYVFATGGVAIVGIFENRYFLLSSEVHHSRWRHCRVAFFIANYTLAVLVFLPPFLRVPDQKAALQEVLKLLPKLPDAVLEQPIFVFTLDTSYIFWTVFCYVALIISEVLLFSYFSWTWLASQLIVSRKSRNLQKMFIQAMYVQISTPTIVFCIPLIYLAISIITTFHNQALNNIAFLIMALHGLLSTVIMLMIHKPYREFCKKIVCL